MQRKAEQGFDFFPFPHYNGPILVIWGDSMKKTIPFFLSLLLLFLTSCSPSAPVSETAYPETIPTAATLPETVPVTIPTEPETTIPQPVVELTEEEKTMLLKLGMAERGREGCTECIALVMCTVLNRVEADRFGSSVKSVILAPEQFTPVMDGTYDSAEPNQQCQDALDMVVYGWDESQGALFYEWCEGESWHSQNLHLLFQHCDVRFYD